MAELRPVRVARKVLSQLRLLRRDPEAFGRNIRQFTHPDAFMSGLLDMPAIPALSTCRAEGGPTLHVLLPSISRGGMTGGPNTVLTIGALLAHDGLRVRFVSCDTGLEGGDGWFWSHLARLCGHAARPAGAVLHDARAAKLPIGPGDLVMASFWTTAHQAAALLPHTGRKRFVYVIQDFEPGFYAWSSRYALSAQTLGLPFDAAINEGTLADFLFESQLGQFADPAFRERCTVFEPAIDRALFRPDAAVARPRRPRRLLVYARPTNPRNLVGLAVEALRQVVDDPDFAPSPERGPWEFLAIGARGSLPPVKLGDGATLVEAPWSDLSGYAATLAESDILLSPMLSPHTGYPVLEMAACGGIGITNTFGAKTAERLQALSPGIIVSAPTVDGFAGALREAAGMVAAGRPRHGTIALPSQWPEALAEVRARMAALMREPLDGRAGSLGAAGSPPSAWPAPEVADDASLHSPTRLMAR